MIITISIYVFYAVMQGAMFNRFFVKDSVGPVAVTIISAIFAPIVSVFLIGYALRKGITVIAMPKDE